MTSFLRSLMLGMVLCGSAACFVGCGEPAHDPSTEPASPNAEDQPVTEAPDPTP